jgi:hypothetical protein
VSVSIQKYKYCSQFTFLDLTHLDHLNLERSDQLAEFLYHLLELDPPSEEYPFPDLQPELPEQAFLHLPEVLQHQDQLAESVSDHSQARLVPAADHHLGLVHFGPLFIHPPSSLTICPI